MFLNVGWIPGYLQRCGELLRQHYAKQARVQKYTKEAYFNKVMRFVDRHPRKNEILSDVRVSQILANCYEEGHTPEYCYAQILEMYY